jgi:hypothetical protein
MEGVARDEWRTRTDVNTHGNEGDLLTKLLPSGEKRKGFVRDIATTSHNWSSRSMICAMLCWMED